MLAQFPPLVVMGQRSLCACVKCLGLNPGGLMLVSYLFVFWETTGFWTWKTDQTRHGDVLGAKLGVHSLEPQRKREATQLWGAL